MVTKEQNIKVIRLRDIAIFVIKLIDVFMYGLIMVHYNLLWLDFITI